MHYYKLHGMDRMWGSFVRDDGTRQPARGEGGSVSEGPDCGQLVFGIMAGVATVA